MSYYIEKQELRRNVIPNPRFVLDGTSIRGWVSSSSFTQDEDGYTVLEYSGAPQSLTANTTEPGLTNTVFSVTAVCTHSASVTLEREDESGVASKTFSLIPGEQRTLYLNHLDGTRTSSASVFRIRWTGSTGAKLTLKDSYASSTPGEAFSGADPEFWTDDPTLQRSYEWDGVEYESTSIEYTGGFEAASWYEPPEIRLPNPSYTPTPEVTFASQLHCEISYGTEWVNLHDGINFKIAAADFGQQTHSWRRKEVNSDFHDGSFTVHAVRENVTEPLSLWVYGDSQNIVTENILLLRELFSQFRYQIRIRYGDHRETWFCQTADYAVERTHVYLHNNMALFKATVPRHPVSQNELVL